MVHVLVLHSALGLRPAVADLAEHIRALGFRVTTPDLFDGVVFAGGSDGYAAAMAHLKTSRDAVEGRLENAYAAVPGPTVILGFSMGAGQAQRLAERHNDVIGALLVAGGERYEGEWDDGGRWRPGIPLACHWMIDDEWMDAAAHAAFVTEAARHGSDVSDYVYPGSGHLFMDGGLPEEFDPAATELFLARVGGFLSRFPSD